MSNPLALIIEDDPKLCNTFQTIMNTVEFETEIALDGLQAQTRLQELVPDLIILDLHLPYISGLELLAQIQADTRLTQAHIVILTADIYKAKDLAVGLEHVLVKPVGFYRLRDLAANIREKIVSSTI